MPNENEIILERNWIFTFLFLKLQIFYPLKALNTTHFYKYFMCYRHYRRVILKEINSDLKAELVYITKAIKSHPKNYQVW